MELLRGLNDTCQALPWYQADNTQPMAFDYCSKCGHQNQMPGHYLTATCFLAPWESPLGIPYATLEDLPSDLAPVAAQTLISLALHQQVSVGTLFPMNVRILFSMDVVLVHLVLFLCSNFQSCPKSWKKMNQNQKKTNRLEWGMQGPRRKAAYRMLGIKMWLMASLPNMMICWLKCNMWRSWPFSLVTLPSFCIK